MARVSAGLDYEIRPYREGDESRVLELLDASLGAGPVGSHFPEFFRWKHFRNPFGQSLMRVAEVPGRIIGLRAFMRWGFEASGRPVEAVSAVDTATHPDHQGRGVFSALTRAALSDLQGSAGLIFNTPNGISLPGYLKMGWHEVGWVPVYLRVSKPVPFLRGVGSLRVESAATGPAPAVAAPAASRVLADESEAVRELLGACASGDGRFRTRRDLTFLEWRYGEAPLLDYRAVPLRRSRHLVGVAFFRVRPRGRLWEAAVADVIVKPGDTGAARDLLRKVRLAAPVDHLTCLFPPGSAQRRAALTSGFMKAPGGVTLATRPLHEGLQPDPVRRSSWALTLGDLEVF